MSKRRLVVWATLALLLAAATWSVLTATGASHAGRVTAMLGVPPLAMTIWLIAQPGRDKRSGDDDLTGLEHDTRDPHDDAV